MDTSRLPDLVTLASTGNIEEVMMMMMIVLIMMMMIMMMMIVMMMMMIMMCWQVDKMVLLVLGCAVTCPGRAQHISVILDMEDIKVTGDSLDLVSVSI